MAQLSKLESDLGYVRSVVTRAETRPAPTAIYLLWAAIVVVGFPLADFAPRHTGTFWMIAGPVGWVISIIVGARAARARGEYDTRLGLRHMAHWGVMLLAVFMAVLLPARGVTSWEVMGPLALLIVATGYVMAGVHLDRLLLWPGLMMAVGFVVLLFGVGYTWTVVGVLVAGGLVVSSLAGGRQRATES